MPRTCGIYGIKNNQNGKIYIGQSVDINGRFARHKTHLKHGRHRNLHLQRSYNKHGAASFEYFVIEECDKFSLAKREQHHIDNNKGNIYNSELCVEDKSGLNNSFFGKHHSEETREKMSLAKKNKYDGDKNPNYGKRHSDETKKIMAVNRASKLSAEDIIKIRLLLSEGEKHESIAKLYGVSRTVITRINSGARWSCIK